MFSFGVSFLVSDCIPRPSKIARLRLCLSENRLWWLKGDLLKKQRCSLALSVSNDDELNRCRRKIAFMISFDVTITYPNSASFTTSSILARTCAFWWSRRCSAPLYVDRRRVVIGCRRRWRHVVMTSRPSGSPHPIWLIRRRDYDD